MKKVFKDFIEASVNIRVALKTTDMTSIKSDIERWQVVGNKLESALSNQKDLANIEKEYSEARKAYKKLKSEYNELLKKTKELKKSQN